jgi:dGTPase
VVLTGLNLCAETLDGIRNHSWSRPATGTVEGEIVSWADRIAYCAHDLEDAAHAGIVTVADLPDEVVEVCGRTRREQLNTFVRAVVRAIEEHGEVGMPADEAAALAALRAFNYERIYVRPDSLAQSRAVVEVLRALVEHYAAHPDLLPDRAQAEDLVWASVTYVAGMTDRYAFDRAVELLDWDPARLPRGIDRNQ